ncbi:MAG TPA: extracellular solute-binding protein [Acidimicrobiales bacterium]|nr:extracellular solute-binding protein [Acidimicrobiales bacterium]
MTSRSSFLRRVAGLARGTGGLTRARSGLLALSLAAGLLVAGAAAAAPAGASGAALTVYSGQHVQTTQALVNAFEKKTGIQVNVRFDDEDVLADQMVTEGGHSPADVFFTENSPPLQYLASKHLLAPIKKTTLAQTPSKYNSPQGLWAGVSARVSVMVYNTSLIKASQLPTSAMQLSQPQWKGKIAIAGSETDFQPIVTSIARTYGNAAALKWLEGVKANAGSHQYPDNETIADEVNRGQVALGIVNQYYWYRERAEIGASNMHSQIAYFAPRDVGYVVDVSGAGILRSSSNQAEAQRFVAFLTSAQGQQIIAHSTSFEYPIASGVTTAQPETPFNQLQPNPISIAQLGTGAQAIKLLQEAQLL